jgi:DNA transformation protein and related proteins
MSASAEFVSYVREMLTPLGNIRDGKFFGGHAIKQGAKQFAMVMGNTLYFRVDDDSRPAYEKRGSKPFSYSTKNGVVQVRKYYAVPAELLDDPVQLVAWARQAVTAASAA